MRYLIQNRPSRRNHELDAATQDSKSPSETRPIAPLRALLRLPAGPQRTRQSEGMALPPPEIAATSRLSCGKSFRPSLSRAKSRRTEFPRRSPPLAIRLQALRNDYQ